MAVEKELEIKLRRTGGVGPNTKWDWQLVAADGTVVKKGSALGEEAKAFATARIARDRPAGLSRVPARAGRPIVALTDPIGDTAEVVRAAGIDAVARLDSVDDTVALLRRLIPAIRAGTAPLPNADYVASASRRGRSRELAALLEAAVLRR